MNTDQVYEQAIKPLSNREKLFIARRIITEIEGTEIEAEAPAPERGFDYLKRILPNIERISLTDEDLAQVKLKGASPE